MNLQMCHTLLCFETIAHTTLLENHAYGPTTGLDVEGTADTCETAVELGAGGDVLENDEHDGRVRWGPCLR
jgi:hypothetical protein